MGNNNFPMMNPNRNGFNQTTNIPPAAGFNNRFYSQNPSNTMMPSATPGFLPLLNPAPRFELNAQPATFQNNVNYDTKPFSYEERISMPQPTFVSTNNYPGFGHLIVLF